MLTLTSLAGQNHFGTLLDTAQRQPVAVTRHGRPVALVMSNEDYQATTQTIPFHVATLVSENYPLRGKAAGDSMGQHLCHFTPKG
jgi:prevent-host-death family protein